MLIEEEHVQKMQGGMRMDVLEMKRAVEYANRARDRRLRCSLLQALFSLRISPSGWVSALKLRAVVDGLTPADSGFEDENHCLGLLRDLVIKGYIKERTRKRRRKEGFGLRDVK